MATGFGLLRLSPEAFWAMTPREMERAMSVLDRGASGSPRKAQMEALMMMFPDRPEVGHG